MTSFIKIPTIIDPHMHYRDLNEFRSGNIHSESLASLEGGVSGGLIMPNTNPPLDTLEAFTKYKNIAKNYCQLLHYRLTILGTETLSRQPQTHIDKMCSTAFGMKLFLTHSHVKPENMAHNIGVWRELFKRIPQTMKIFVHVEDSSKFLEFLSFAKDYKYHYHICHVHTKAILDLIIFYRKEFGMKITCEACPHHLLKMCLGCHVKPSPATGNDINYLIQNIEHIDCLATDHAPHINKENPGIASTEFTLQIYFTLVKQGILTLERMILMACINPRILLEINDLYEYLDKYRDFVITLDLQEIVKKGVNGIDIYKTFDLLYGNYLIVNTDAKGILPRKFKYSKGINSIYFGMKYYGKIEAMEI